MMWTASPQRHLLPRRGRRSATKRETVHEEIYQNWRRFGQELFSDSRAGERRRPRRDAQVDAHEDAGVLFADRTVPRWHGGVRFGALLGSRTRGDGSRSAFD